MFIQLTACDEFGVGHTPLLLNTEQIQSIESIMTMKPVTCLTMTPVVSGFHGDDDEIYDLQNEYFVRESTVQNEMLAH